MVESGSFYKRNEYNDVTYIKSPGRSRAFSFTAVKNSSIPNRVNIFL